MILEKNNLKPSSNCMTPAAIYTSRMLPVMETKDASIGPIMFPNCCAVFDNPKTRPLNDEGVYFTSAAFREGLIPMTKQLTNTESYD